MKTRLWLLSLILLVILMSACQPATPTPNIPQPTVQSSPTPESSSAGTGAYPAPQVAAATEPINSPGSALYPGIGDGEEVQWEKAVAMILNGEVLKAVESPDLMVSLSLKDGRTLKATQLIAGDLLQVIQNCGDPCTGIEVVTP